MSTVEKKDQMPDYIKEKILLFFLKTSVPRIIAEDREKESKAN